MGDPRRQRRKHETPRFPWRTDVLQSELKLIGQYGLRNKRELWRHKTTLSRFRELARSLLGMPAEQRQRIEKQLLDRLNRLGILAETAVLDDVLDLAIEDLLERRLQTMVFSKGLAKSVYQARQLITHGHIAIDGKRVPSPSYIVLKDDEAKLAYAPTSNLSKSDHPIRLSISAEGQGKPEARVDSHRREGVEENA
jgi:small subunit ribosomal protein S4